MNRYIGLSFCLMLVLSLYNSLYAYKVTCKKADTPQISSSLKDYEIIAQNVAKITTDKNFKGNNLKFYVSAHPTNFHNKVRINNVTGQVTISAENKDNFDVIVKAKNSCGSVSSKFNVIIDEEI